MKHASTILIVTVSLIVSSCNMKTRESEITHLMKEWNGKEFLFSDSIKTMLKKCNSLKYERCKISSDFCIVYYLDEDVCSSCRINSWRNYIRGLTADSEGKVSSILIISPRIKEMDIEDNRSETDYLIVQDYDNIIKKKNNLPDDDLFKVMLLDKQNKVVVIGNPLLNKGMDKLIRKAIGINNSQENIKAKLVLELNQWDYGTISSDTTSVITFAISNEGPNPAFIKRLSSTCDCVKAKISSHVLYPDDSAKVEISLSPMYKGKIKEHVFIESNTIESPHTIKISAYAN